MRLVFASIIRLSHTWRHKILFYGTWSEEWARMVCVWIYFYDNFMRRRRRQHQRQTTSKWMNTSSLILLLLDVVVVIIPFRSILFWRSSKYYYRRCHLLENLILYMCFDLPFLFAEQMRASESEQAFDAGSFLSGLSNLKIKFSFLDLFRCLSLSACDFPFFFFLIQLHFSLGVCRIAYGRILNVIV